MKFLTKIFGTRNEKTLKQLQPTIAQINQLESSFKSLSDEELQAQTPKFRERISRGEPLDKILPEAFAVTREASRRVLGQRHYDVQLIGGIVLHQGNISEMKTGEGKTLTATLPCYLHGLTGLGAHVVTVNDYLARRDAEWMGKVYNFLGLSVGIIQHDIESKERYKAYQSDITYGTNNEFGFDYLRDNMKVDPNSLVQNGQNFAIVDEVDSILIDEARTPLIISGPTESDRSLYTKVNAVIPGLQKDSDYIVDEKNRHVSLTEDGIYKLEQRLRLENLYDPKNIDTLHHCEQALKAHTLFKKDVDYVVRQNEVMIVDEFTGRLMPGRRYSDGLHGALEAKEHVTVQQESQTLANITFQNYFRLYKTLAGMTGTADTEAVEFSKIYKLDVVVIPTNRNLIRDDQEDLIYRTAREKFEALADDIAETQKKGQPILVGTVSVERSELLSGLLKQRNIPHYILNAKNHAAEASIIEHAGEKGRVTIATNMAGRGTDIQLAEGVTELGGLYVIATERHESRRIDNQLRGRSGRQGDPGKTKFYLSLEDDLMRIFASDRLSSLMERIGMAEGEAIVSPMVTRAIEKAQRRVEEQNFSSRKHVLEYDDVMNQQRQVIYNRRKNALLNQDKLDFFEPTIEALANQIVSAHSPENLDKDYWDLEGLEKELTAKFHLSLPAHELDKDNLSADLLHAHYFKIIKDEYEKRLKLVHAESFQKMRNQVYLQIIDRAWKDHLLAMDALKDAVSLRGYGQRDPLQEYKKEAFDLFSNLMLALEEETTLTILKICFDIDPSQFEAQSEEDAQVSFDLAEKDFSEESLVTNEDQHDGQASGGGLIYPKGAKENRASSSPEPYRREGEKVGRNDPCPCGSGKKYKKCHGK